MSLLSRSLELFLLCLEAALCVAIVLKVPCEYVWKSEARKKIDPHLSVNWMCLIFLGLLPVSCADTEIDWTAYMQEVEGWALGGDTNYLNLKGDTGPLVYPAGFLYVYRALWWLTDGGRGAAAIRVAQWVFVSIYLLTQGVVFAVYRRARCVNEPPVPSSTCVRASAVAAFVAGLGCGRFFRKRLALSSLC